MKCGKCGNEIGDNLLFCPFCGAEQDKTKESDKKRKTLLIVLIFLSAAVLIGVGIFLLYNFYGVSHEKKLQNKIDKVTDKDIVEFFYDDFNNDKTYEAFAVVGDGSSDSFKNGEIWYVNDESEAMVKDKISGSVNGVIEEDNNKYISVEITGDGDSASYIYGVKDNGKFFEPPASGMFKKVHQSGDKIVTGDNSEIRISTGKAEHETTPSKAETESTTDNVEETTKAATTAKTAKTTKPTTKAASDNWRTAYKEYIINNFPNDSNYVEYGNSAKFFFGYIDDNDIPELMISMGSYHYAHVIVLTYYNGNVINLGSFSQMGTITYYEKKGYFSAFAYYNQGRGGSEVHYNLKNGSLSVLWSGSVVISDVSSQNMVYTSNEAEVSEEEYNAQRDACYATLEMYSSSKKTTGYGGYAFTLENVNKLETLPIEKNISNN